MSVDELQAAISRLSSEELDRLSRWFEEYVSKVPKVLPRDEWERRLLGAATDCGVSLPDSALSSDGLYDTWPT